MEPDAFSESLAYPQVKRRAVASRSYRSKIAASNGSVFSAGQTVNIDLPSNLAATYINWNQAYLKFKVVSSAACILDRCGAAGFISRVQCQTSGAQIFDLPNWNVLMTCLMDSDSGVDYKANVGNILMGTRGDSQRGEGLAASGDGRTFCIPMVLHPLAMSTPHRLTPVFSLSPLQFKITLDAASNSVVADAAPTLTFSEVELVVVMTELSPNAQAQVDQMTGGVYNILCSSYQNVGSTTSAGAGVVTSTLGISVSSLERIILCQRRADRVNAPAAYSLGHRQKNFLQEYQFYINGESYPNRPVLVDEKGAEAYAEYLLSDHSLVNFNKSSSIQLRKDASGNNFESSIVGVEFVGPYTINDASGESPGQPGMAAANAADIGSFLSAVEFDFLADGKSEKLYGGVSTIGSTVTYRGVYGSGAKALQLDFFAQFTVLISLNMRGTGVFSVSV